jgi:hypothetical protein
MSAGSAGVLAWASRSPARRRIADSARSSGRLLPRAPVRPCRDGLRAPANGRHEPRRHDQPSPARRVVINAAPVAASGGKAERDRCTERGGPVHFRDARATSESRRSLLRLVQAEGVSLSLSRPRWRIPRARVPASTETVHRRRTRNAAGGPVGRRPGCRWVAAVGRQPSLCRPTSAKRARSRARGAPPHRPDGPRPSPAAGRCALDGARWKHRQN